MNSITGKGKPFKEKKHKWLSLEKKKEILEEVNKGRRITDVAYEYGVPRSTVTTYCKNKDKIMSAKVSFGTVKMLDKNRTAINHEMEDLLLVWIKERRMKGDPVTQSIVCNKARTMYKELLENTPEVTNKHEFKASRGWFHRFKGRTGFHLGTCGVDDIDNQTEEFVNGFEDLIKVELTEENNGDEEEYLHNNKHEVPTSVIKDILFHWDKVQTACLKWHPNTSSVHRTTQFFSNTIINHFEQILKKRETDLMIATTEIKQEVEDED